MFEAGDDARFSREAPGEGLVVEKSGGQDLEGDGPIQGRIVCFVDHAHSAAAERAAHDELRDLGAGGQIVEPVLAGSGNRWARR